MGRVRPHPRETTGRRAWSFLTSHAQVLVCLHDDPTSRIADVAARTGLTERTVKAVIDDLEQGGYVRRQRVGRRNTYEIDRDRPVAADGAPVGGLLDVAGSLAGLDYQDVLDLTARRATEAVAADASLLGLIEDGNRVEPLALHHRDDDRRLRWWEAVRAGSFGAIEAVTDRTLAEGRPLLVRDVRASAVDRLDERARRLVDEFSIASALFAPLVLDRAGIGMVVTVRVDGHPPFTERDADVLSALADGAVAALVEARRDRANLAVEAYGTLFATSLDGVIVATEHGRFLAANPAACRLLGGTEDQVLRLSPEGLAVDTDGEPIDPAGRHADGEVVEYRGTVRRVDGTAVDLEIRRVVFETTAGQRRVCAVFHPAPDDGHG